MYKKYIVLTTYFCGIPSVVFAEILDKLPSIQSILLESFLLGIVLFFLAHIKWKFGIFLLIIPFVFSLENYSIWRELGMRKAILLEQGYVYFFILFLECFLLFFGVLSGILCGLKSNGNP